LFISLLAPKKRTKEKAPLAFRSSAYGGTALAKRLFAGAPRTRFAQTACRPISVPKRFARLRSDGVKNLKTIKNLQPPKKLIPNI
jgi:hypothetical protein